MIKKTCSTLFLFLFCFSIYASGAVDENKLEDIVSVIKFKVKNDGSKIGAELNELVKKSYGKTLYFPAGTYNLTEPIILPFDYTKNVNIVFDKNAVIKTDLPLEALLKIGYTEMSTPDVTHRRFSYIEGGMFDCSNVDNGIMVNGLKQLVSLRAMSLFKGRKTHIRIHVTDDFRGTGSCDTKIDNITIQGVSSNEEVYGVYIDHSCCDVKMSNTFIYGTKYGIVTKSAGLILNHIHILSMNTGGGLNLGVNNFKGTEGIRVETGGFFVFNEVYFDTLDKSIILTKDVNPTLILDKNIFYSYLKNFGTSFIYKDHGAIDPFQVKISNSIIEVAKQGYKIFDVNPEIIGKDVENNFTFVNSAIRSPQLLSPFDLSLLQRIRGERIDAILQPEQNVFSEQWVALGAILASPVRSLLRIDLSEDCAVELSLLFKKGEEPQISSKTIGATDNLSFQIGYSVKDNFCVLFIKSKQGAINPFICDLLGNGSFMTTPSKKRIYSLSDYEINEIPTIIVENNKL